MKRIIEIDGKKYRRVEQAKNKYGSYGKNRYVITMKFGDKMQYTGQMALNADSAAEAKKIYSKESKSGGKGIVSIKKVG
tara:strand:+ start:89 stop:325 length:237 start_codon:yes stop_codon:yes gene_type:complete